MDTQDTVVLAVDDSSESLSLINDALEQVGFSVLIALEGKQAINIAEKMRPDIILLDAIMPQLDGFETCKMMKANPLLMDIPIIFMTGLADTESIIKGLEAGGVDYLTKPIAPDELVARMRVHLANAEISAKAQSALDITGQHLFTVNQQGSLTWATPQAKALFNEANINTDWIQRQLSQQIMRWLATKPAVGQSLKLNNIVHPLSIRIIEHASGQEILLKLINGKAPSGAEKLKQQLPITERESDVLYWIANGKTNREIGQILDTSPRTINKHLEQIFKKLEVDNRTSAAAIAIRLIAVD
ncbi:MAG: response regulator [Pseudomonadales bacterium]|nr:response regulator [Pseudomonadales bacterium]